MDPIADPGAPNKRWSCDVLEPLCNTRRRNRFLLVFIDHFTKWVKAFPMISVESHKVAEKCINDIVFRHGCPKALLTDQGTNFTSKLIKDLTKLLGCRKLQGTPTIRITKGRLKEQIALYYRSCGLILMTQEEIGTFTCHMHSSHAVLRYKAARVSHTMSCSMAENLRLPVDMELNHMLRSFNDPRDCKQKYYESVLYSRSRASAGA